MVAIAAVAACSLCAESAWAQSSQSSQVESSDLEDKAHGVPVISTGPSQEKRGVSPRGERSLSVEGLIRRVEASGRQGVAASSEGSGVPVSSKGEAGAEVAAEMASVSSSQSPPQEGESGASSYDIPFLLDDGGGEHGVPLKLNSSAALSAELSQSNSSSVSAVGTGEDVGSAVEAAGGRKPSGEVSLLSAPAGSVAEEGGERDAVEVPSGVEAVEALSWSDPDPAIRGGHSSFSADPNFVRDAPEVRGEGGDSGETRLETWESGYFPTRVDTYYLGDKDYARYRGFENHVWPDTRAQLATGVGPFGHQEPTFFDQHAYVFEPLDAGLGLFADHEALLIESGQVQHFSFALDPDLPFITRNFEPEKAHVKGGPFYLDLLSVGAGALYSDYEGPQEFKRGEEDGWLSFLELQMRALMQVSNNFFIAASGRMVYLPQSNRVAFRLGNGYGPNVLGRLNYQERLGAWDVLVYDDFRARSYGDLFDSGAIERAGRYYYGFTDTLRGRDYFDDEAFFFLNTAGAKASTLLSPDWRLNAMIDRSDIWQTHDFINHATRHHAGALLGYEGSRIPFSPYARYDVNTVDDFDSFFHTAYVGGRGRLTENLRVDARGGYLWSTSRPSDHDSWLWRVSLTHDLSQRTVHGLTFGQDFFIDDFTNQTLVSDYARYHIGHQVSRNAYAQAYAQLSEDEYLHGRETNTGSTQIYGANVNVRPWDYTRVTGGAAYQMRDIEDGRDNERMLYYLRLDHQLMSRTTLWFKYQFEEAEYFDEHLYSGGIRKYF